MQEVLRYALLGLGIGALYALASQGLLLIYRGSGVLNFAHGAIGMVGAYFEYELQYNHGWSLLPALLVGLAVSALLGAITQLLIMRPLRRASPLARVVATLGVLIILESLGYLRYQNDPLFPKSEPGTSNIHIYGQAQVPLDDLVLTGIAVVLSALLWALYRSTRFGLGTAAVAENQRAAASLGWSPDVIATANWALGAALAGVAAILIAPIVALQVSTMTNLLLAAMATALIASFRSFPIAVVAGLVIGIVQTEIARYVSQPGLGSSLPFLVIVVVMVVRGQALPLRDFFLQRLPRLGSGRIRPGVVLVAVFALPAVRARGINLAIVTLGLGSAFEYMVFDNPAYTGGFYGSTVNDPHLFGLDVNNITHSNRFGLLTFGCFVLAALAVANMRRGRSGRRLIAVRTNERAAAALGINVISAKLYAFALAGSIAGLGGILLAFQNSTITYGSYMNFTSISDVGFAVIGGIGYILGPVIGAVFTPGAVGIQVSNVVLVSLSRYVPLISGGILVLLVLRNQDGTAKPIISWLHWVDVRLRPGPAVGPRRRARLAGGLRRRRPLPPVPAPEHRERVPPRTLEVHDLTVRFGPVVAVQDVSLRVEPGRVVGLIGPNGAGKTTFIDAVTGFTRPTSGGILLDGRRIGRWSPARRARAGVSRSFQSLELFEDATVLDNIRIAADPRDLASYLLDLAHLVRRLAAEWGMSILVVEHDMDFVMSVCDEIVVLDFGRRLATGPPADIRRDPAVIAAYLGTAEDEAAGVTS